MQSVKKVASIALSVVMWIIILVAALYAFTTLATHEDGSVSDIAGFTPLAVQSDSMAPTFNKGDPSSSKSATPQSSRWATS